MPAQSSGAAAGRIEPVGNTQHVRFVHHDAIRIAAVGDAAENFVLAVVGEGQVVLAILLLARKATGALAAGIDHATHRGDVTFLEFRNAAPDSRSLGRRFRAPAHTGKLWASRRATRRAPDGDRSGKRRNTKFRFARPGDAGRAA